jgi:hypothetical protein
LGHATATADLLSIMRDVLVWKRSQRLRARGKKSELLEPNDRFKIEAVVSGPRFAYSRWILFGAVNARAALQRVAGDGARNSELLATSYPPSIGRLYQ